MKNKLRAIICVILSFAMFVFSSSCLALTFSQIYNDILEGKYSEEDIPPVFRKHPEPDMVSPSDNRSKYIEINSLNFDLSSLSYEELLVLQVKVEEALEQKSIQLGSFKVSSGKYVIGDEIPAGTYRCECKGAYSATILHVYEKESDLWPIVSEVMAEMYGSSIIGKLELQEGYILEIEGGTIDFTPYTGIHS